jgi:hypothetical protein
MWEDAVSRRVQVEGGELRYQEQDGEEYLDEIVASAPRHVHVEVMSDTRIWMGIELADGSFLTVDFYAKNGRSRIEYCCEVEPIGPTYR